MREYQQFSTHTIDILRLEGQFWQWRLLGGAVTLAEHYAQHNPDLIIASDMLDLATFVALAKPTCPIIIYFHENQLIYPRGPRQKLQNHYAFINYTSALVADKVLFNSQFHQAVFLDELPRLLNHYPDHKNLHTVEQIRAKSDVLPIGIDLRKFDAFHPQQAYHKSSSQTPLIIWNHRWEFDKNPQLFVNTVLELRKAGYAFRIAITGEQFVKPPDAFDTLKNTFGNDAVQLGYVETFAGYAQLLWDADIVISTAIQDFFGISVVEAMYCACFPLLPNRVNYPWLIPETLHPTMLYDQDAALYHKLVYLLENQALLRENLQSHVLQYDWRTLTAKYDDVFARMISQI